MLRINYEFKAKSPIHTCSDEDYGTLKRLRRLKIITNEEIKLESNFVDDNLKRDGIIYILKEIFKKIDKTNMKQNRLYNIYEEFQHKILASANTVNRFSWLDSLCTKLNIRSLDDEKILYLLDKFNDIEFFELLRNELQYLILKMRVELKNKNDNNDLFSVLEKSEKGNVKIEKKYYEIPFISGNSIRGILRRIVMKDFCEITGIKKMNKKVYHQLFTGGTITDSTAYEDIDKREELIKTCPAIGLFGSAIGNMTIEGDMKVGMAFPKCKELKTGKNSFWNLIDIIFQTRHDSSKTEKDIEIVEIAKEVNQMKYEYEVFLPGTEFNHSFVLISNNELIESCFYRMLKLFINNNYICGISGVGNGEIDLTNLLDFIEDKKDKVYLDYLDKNKDEIKKKIEEVYD